MITLHNDYEAWASEPRRERSNEVDFGVFWTYQGMPFPKWRVSWIEATGEVYAKELGGQERFAVLARADNRTQADALMRGWTDYDLRPKDLSWIVARELQ